MERGASPLTSPTRSSAGPGGAVLVEVFSPPRHDWGAIETRRAPPRPVAVSAARESLERAKARLDRALALPTPGADRAGARDRLARRSSGCRGFAASTATPPGRRSCFASAPCSSDADLLCHELCHVWQMQHRPLAMPLSYLRSGYAAQPLRGRGARGGRGDPWLRSARSRPARRSGSRTRPRRGWCVCVNGGRAREVAGTWSSTLEWLVAKLAPRFPALGFGEVRYRIKSWRQLELCIEDARAAIDAAGGERTLLVGFSMGGAVAISAADEPGVERGARAGAVDPRPPRPLAARRQAPRRPPRLARPLAAGGARRLGLALPARLRAGAGERGARELHADPRRPARARAAHPRRAARCRSPAPPPGRGSSRLSSRGSPAEAARRSICACVGSRTFQTRPSFSSPRITHQERSNWKRRRPWRAEAGKAWWLLCHPSPKTSIATTQLLRDSSRHLVVAPAEHVADRVHAEGRVLVEEDAHEPAPDQPLDPVARARRARSRSRTGSRASPPPRAGRGGRSSGSAGRRRGPCRSGGPAPSRGW